MTTAFDPHPSPAARLQRAEDRVNILLMMLRNIKERGAEAKMTAIGSGRVYYNGSLESMFDSVGEAIEIMEERITITDALQIGGDAL